MEENEAEESRSRRERTRRKRRCFYQSRGRKKIYVANQTTSITRTLSFEKKDDVRWQTIVSLSLRVDVFIRTVKEKQKMSVFFGCDSLFLSQRESLIHQFRSIDNTSELTVRKIEIELTRRSTMRDLKKCRSNDGYF